MRPSAVPAGASVITSAAAPTAREPRWTRCQSLANPSWLEYWHIGETTMRWGSVRPREVNESNSEAIYEVEGSPCAVRTGSVANALVVVTGAARYRRSSGVMAASPATAIMHPRPRLITENGAPG